MKYLDAHNHLHDARLDDRREAMLAEAIAVGLRGAVVNGTQEADWDAVAKLCAGHDWMLPSFGLHPWRVSQRSPEWLSMLRQQLQAHPHASIGEVGLDRWIQDHDLPDQIEVFRVQLALAAELARPVTIHCIRAWGALDEVLREFVLPAGFLIHAYGGPREMLPRFLEAGAYFSFSPYFLHERKAANRDVFQHIPRERLLVETDAPDLAPPDEANPRRWTDLDGRPLNHPANIDLAFRGLADTLGLSLQELAEQVSANFVRLFRSNCAPD